MSDSFTQEELDNYIFSRLHARTSWVFLESPGIHIIDDLLDFLLTKKNLEMPINSDTFRIFHIKEPAGAPTLSAVNKKLLTKDMVANYIEIVMKDPGQAKRMRESSGEQDVIAIASPSDLILPLVFVGMDQAFRKWQKNVKKQD